MAIDYITVTRTSRPQLGAQLVRLANMLREVRDLCDAVNDAAGRMHDGANYATLETNFGLATGQGANAATLFGLLNEILNTNTDVTGANRLSRLDEFAARIAGQ